MTRTDKSLCKFVTSIHERVWRLCRSESGGCRKKLGPTRWLLALQFIYIKSVVPVSKKGTVLQLVSVIWSLKSRFAKNRIIRKKVVEKGFFHTMCLLSHIDQTLFFTIVWCRRSGEKRRFSDFKSVLDYPFVSNYMATAVIASVTAGSCPKISLQYLSVRDFRLWTVAVVQLCFWHPRKLTRWQNGFLGVHTSVSVLSGL